MQLVQNCIQVSGRRGRTLSEGPATLSRLSKSVTSPQVAFAGRMQADTADLVKTVEGFSRGPHSVTSPLHPQLPQAHIQNKAIHSVTSIAQHPNNTDCHLQRMDTLYPSLATQAHQYIYTFSGLEDQLRNG